MACDSNHLENTDAPLVAGAAAGIITAGPIDRLADLKAVELPRLPIPAFGNILSLALCVYWPPADGEAEVAASRGRMTE